MKNEKDVNAKMQKEMRCAFCGNHKDETYVLVGGSGSSLICNTCVEDAHALFVRTMKEQLNKKQNATPKAIVPEMTDEEIEKEFDKLWKEKDWGNIRFDLTIADIYNLAHAAFEKGIGKRTASSDKKVSRPMYIDREKAIEIVKSTLYATLGNTGTGKDTLLCTEIVDDIILSGTFREQLTGWISVDKELPKDKIGILFISKQGLIRSGHYDKDMKLFRKDNGTFKDNITHWQPLPTPPTK